MGFLDILCSMPGEASANDRAHDNSSSDLLQQVYEQLRTIARSKLSDEKSGHTLQATALVHEAWLKIAQRDSVMALERSQFLVAAAEAMRRILIDHARTRGRIKRGGGAKRSAVEMTDIAALAMDHDPEEIMALDDAIRRLEIEDADAARVVKLRFFAGLSVPETAECLGTSERTVKREWQFARAWLFRALS